MIVVVINRREQILSKGRVFTGFYGILTEISLSSERKNREKRDFLGRSYTIETNEKLATNEEDI